jgi:hypothetical protein
LQGENLCDLNDGMVALLPKKDNTMDLSHFWPISLIHSLGKLISKVLAIRLSRQMDKLISPAQTAVSKSRCIHDTCMYMCNVVRTPHWKKKHALLLKIEIAGAFDSVSLEYLFELMQAI